MIVFSFGKAAAGALLVLSAFYLFPSRIGGPLPVFDLLLGVFLLWTCVEEHNTPNFGG